MSPSPPPTLTVAGTTLGLVVRRKNVKNVNARLRGGSLHVSAPMRMGAAELDRVIAELARRLVRRERARVVNREADLLGVARRIAARFPEPPEVRDVRFSTRQRTQWGCCNVASGTILVNAALAHMPGWVLEAVIAHELAHLFQRDHGPRFRALLDEVCPENQRARTFLAGVTWLAGRWPSIPEVERSQLAGAGPGEGDLDLA